MALSFLKGSKRGDGDAPTLGDLRRQREALQRDEAALTAARQAVEHAEADRDALDADLDPQAWHRERAAREQAVVDAVREVERLTASVARRRDRCREIAWEVETEALAPVEARIAARREREQQLVRELARIEAEQAQDETLREALVEARELAVEEFLPRERRWQRETMERELRREAEWIGRQREQGLPYPAGPGVEKLIPKVRREAEARERAALEAHRSLYPHPEAAEAGVSRFDPDSGFAALDVPGGFARDD